MVTLLYNYYKDISLERQNELSFCFYKNIDNKNIDKIVVFHAPNIELPKSNKIQPIIINSNKILSFTDLFNYGNSIEGVKIIANSDIYFDKTINKCKNIKENEVYALSRWDNVDNNLILYSNEYSQDCWIWRDKIFVNVYFGLGIPACDNVLANVLKKLGYNVQNPALSIKAIHYHNSKIRNYEKEGIIKKYRIIGKSASIKITELT